MSRNKTLLVYHHLELWKQKQSFTFRPSVEDAMAEPSTLESRRQQKMERSYLCSHRKGTMGQKVPTCQCCPGRPQGERKPERLKSDEYIRRSWAKGQWEGASPGRGGHTCTIKFTGSAGKKNTKEEKKEEKKNTDIVAIWQKETYNI